MNKEIEKLFKTIKKQYKIRTLIDPGKHFVLIDLYLKNDQHFLWNKIYRLILTFLKDNHQTHSKLGGGVLIIYREICEVNGRTIEYHITMN